MKIRINKLPKKEKGLPLIEFYFFRKSNGCSKTLSVRIFREDFEDLRLHTRTVWSLVGTKK